MTGQTISHYRIDGKAGEGGMGVVYRAWDLKLERTVALKFLGEQSAGDTDARERFLREARAAASLDHPNVNTVYEIGEADGKMFIAMAFVEGETVKSKLAARPLPLDEALDIAIQAGEGIAAAHANGIVHRDIKSANLMVTAGGGVKVMDFGLAQVAGQVGITKSRTTLGTVMYMSPEQAQNQTAGRTSDIWSLGVVIYEMIAARLPFAGGHDAAVMYSIIHDTPEPLTALRAGVPAALDRVLAKAMAKAPSERYQHVDDLLVDLRALRQGLPVNAPDPMLRRKLLYGTAAAAAAIGAAIVFRSGGSGARITSLVVLPLENLSRDPEQEYFADGMTDALTTDLSKIASLRTISRQTAMQYKGSKKSLRDIARELNVDAVVGGSVVREAGRVRVTAHLIDGSTDRNLWAESYEREITGVLSLQGEVARKIAGEVRVTLRPDEERRLTRDRKVNPETYEAYLKGVFWMSKGTPQAFDKAVEFLQSAVDKDPADPLAYAGLALGYATASHLSDLPDHKVPKARAAAERALQLDDSSAEAHLVLGILAGYRDFMWEACERGIQKAISLNPNMAFAHFQMGWFHCLYQRFDLAIESGTRTLSLDPMSVIHHWVLDYYRIARRYDEAIAHAKRALDSDPNNFIARIVLGNTYTATGRYEEAIVELKKAAAIAPGFRGFYLTEPYVKSGRIAEARRLLAEYAKLPLTGFNAFTRGTIHTLLGEHDAALRLLAFEPHHDWITALPFETAFFPLRKDPRYLALVKKMNLTVPKQ